MKTDVIIVGWGTAAHFFAHKIENSLSFQVVGIANRNHADTTPFTSIEMDKITPNFEGIILLCVNDDNIAQVAQSLHQPSAIVAHVAGSVSLSALDGCKNAGVFYPLQTLSDKGATQFPILIESKDETIVNRLEELATGCDLVPYSMSSDERLKLHLAAVMTNNFTHHLLSSIKEYLSEHKLDATLLEALLQKTVGLFTIGKNGFDLQTGPAKRNDMNTIDKHLQMLEENPELKELYQFYTLAIQRKNLE